MYLADGTNIRVINRDGNIHTLIGHHKHNNIWQPMPCKTTVPTSQVCQILYDLGEIHIFNILFY